MWQHPTTETVVCYKGELSSDLTDPLNKFISQWKEGRISLEKHVQRNTPDSDRHDPFHCSKDALSGYIKRGCIDTATHTDMGVFNVNTRNFIHYDDVINSIIWALASELPRCSIKLSGHFLYKGQNSYMGWHTNCGKPGLRVYFNYVSEDNKSFFRYYNPHTREIITSYDKKGWQARLFEIHESNPLWHCVYSDVDRVSIGFRVYPNLA